MTGAAGLPEDLSPASCFAEEVVGHQDFVDAAQPGQHQVAEAALHGIADEQGPREHGRADGHAAGDRHVHFPEMPDREQDETNSDMADKNTKYECRNPKQIHHRMQSDCHGSLGLVRFGPYSEAGRRPTPAAFAGSRPAARYA